MLEKHVIGLDGLPLIGAGLFSLTIGLMLGGFSIPFAAPRRRG